MIDLLFCFQMLRCQELRNEESNVLILIHLIQVPIHLILIHLIQGSMWSGQIQSVLNDFKKSDQIELIQLIHLIQIKLIQLIQINLIRQNEFKKSDPCSKTRSQKGD